MAKPNGHITYLFDGFRLDGDKMLLYRGEVPTALPPKAVETLAALVRRRGEIVGKEDLIEAVWRGTVVEESNLTQYLYLIRKALGTRRDGRPYIETLRKRGYRFDADSFVIEASEGRGADVGTETRGTAENILEFRPRARPAERNTAGAAPMKRFAALAVIQAVLLVAVIGAVAWFNSGAADANDKEGQLDFLHLTDGIEPSDAVISPDGKYFAYTELDGARSRMWIQQTGQGNRQEVISWESKWIGPKTFSPDSQFIYYVEGDPAVDNTLYRVPAFGGPRVKILSGIFGPISFGPGGREFVYYRHLKSQKLSQILIRQVDGTGTERVAHSWADSTPLTHVAWSPDGKKVAFTSVVERESGGFCSVNALILENSKTEPISTEDWEGCYRIAWRADGSGIYGILTKPGDGYSTRRDHLYFISYPGGQSRRVTTDGSRHQTASLSVTDDERVLVVPYNRNSQIWSMDPNGDTRTAVQITKGMADGRAGIAPAAGGRVAYIARTGDNLAVWSVNADGSDPRQLTFDPQYMEELRSGGDGRYLFFSAPRGRLNDLYRMNSDGTELKRMTDQQKVIDSGVSRDGRWIVYSGTKISGLSFEQALWKMPTEGGTPERLGNIVGCDMPHFSPDGKNVSCVEEQSRAKIVSAVDGSLVKTLGLLPRSTVNFGARWSPDGKALVYIVTEKDVSNLWLHPIDGSPPQRLTDFTAGSIYHFVYSLDGSRLFLARGTQIRDAVLISRLKY